MTRHRRAASALVSLAAACGGLPAGEVAGTPAAAADARPPAAIRDALPGPSCALYCALAETRCAQAAAMVTTLLDCPAACAALPALGEAGDRSGDTLGCRMTYLLMAGGALHEDCCRLAAVEGSPLCSAVADGEVREPKR